MPTVYLVQQGTFNLTPAKEWGNVKVLMPPMVQMLFDDPLMVDQIAEGLKHIKPEDYLLLAGDPVLIGIVTAIAADMLDGEINLLKWDRQEKVYLPLHLSLYGAVN